MLSLKAQRYTQADLEYLQELLYQGVVNTTCPKCNDCSECPVKRACRAIGALRNYVDQELSERK